VNFAAIQRWLELELDADAAIVRAAVAWHGEGSRAAGVVASCPARERTPEVLAAVALAAFEQAATVEHEVAGRGTAPTAVIGQPVFIGQMCVGALAWEVHAGDDANGRNPVDALGRACERLVAWLQPKGEATPPATTTTSAHAAALVLALTGEAVKANGVVEAARRVAALIVAERIALSASIGLCDPRAGSRIRLVAMSDAASIDEGSPLALALRAAMDECAHQQRSIVYPAPRESQPVIDLAHSQLARQPGATNVCSVPMASDGAVVGVLTLQRAGAAATGDAELSMLEHVAAFVGPALALQQRAETRFAARPKGPGAGRASGRSEQLLKKWWPAAAALAVAGACLLPAQHQIAAPARLHGSLERALVAPHDGYIAKAHVKPGDRVVAGQVLAEFELEGVLLERRRLEAELSQAENTFGEALGKRDRAQLAIQQARIDQARSRLDLVMRDVDKARVTAPFAGVVLNGDLSRSVGTPVKRGDLLMTVAPEEGFRLMLWVDERDVGYVRLDQPGRLLLAASPHDALPLKVSRVTPVAVAREAANGFEVEASVQGAAAGLRPGLEGIAKLNAGTRPLAWVVGHRFTHWLSLKWWAWLG
jgi:multidrug efflux pump subunit AcrA (membrane-fusion protein)